MTWGGGGPSKSSDVAISLCFTCTPILDFYVPPRGSCMNLCLQTFCCIVCLELVFTAFLLISISMTNQIHCDGTASLLSVYVLYLPFVQVPYLCQFHFLCQSCLLIQLHFLSWFCFCACSAFQYKTLCEFTQKCADSAFCADSTFHALLCVNSTIVQILVFVLIPAFHGNTAFLLISIIWLVVLIDIGKTLKT